MRGFRVPRFRRCGAAFTHQNRHGSAGPLVPTVVVCRPRSFLIAGARRILPIRGRGDRHRPQPVRRPTKLPKVMHGIHKTATCVMVGGGRGAAAAAVRVAAVYHNHRWNEGRRGRRRVKKRERRISSKKSRIKEEDRRWKNPANPKDRATMVARTRVTTESR